MQARDKQIQELLDKVSKLEATQKPSQPTSSIPTKGSSNHSAISRPNENKQRGSSSPGRVSKTDDMIGPDKELPQAKSSNSNLKKVGALKQDSNGLSKSQKAGTIKDLRGPS